LVKSGRIRDFTEQRVGQHRLHHLSQFRAGHAGT
jgi:hypothetical protein